jgi:hypothetical protein
MEITSGKASITPASRTTGAPQSQRNLQQQRLGLSQMPPNQSLQRDHVRKLVKEQLYQQEQQEESSPVDLHTQNFAESPSTNNFNQLQQDFTKN